MRKVAFLCNPSPKWRGKFARLQRELQLVTSFEKKIFQVNPAQIDSTENSLSQAFSEGYQTVISVGGDGTLNRVINFFGKKKWLSKVTLGLVAFGTCNDFAKTLGLKKGEWSPVIQSILREKTGKFKVAKVNQHLFINNAGFGRKAPNYMKSNLLKDIQSLKPIPAKLFWEDHKLEGNFMMMVCANGPYFSDGLHFSLHSDPTDSQLEFFFVGKMSKLRLITKLILGKSGRALLERPTERSILKIQCSKLTMETASPIWVMRDGESSGDLSAISRVIFEIDGDCKFIIP